MRDILDPKLIQDTARDDYGIDLTLDQAKALCEERDIVATFAIGGFDTVTREKVASVLARRIIGRDWPMYGDGRPALERFVEDMREKAPQLGYTLLPGFGET